MVLEWLKENTPIIGLMNYDSYCEKINNDYQIDKLGKKIYKGTYFAKQITLLIGAGVFLAYAFPLENLEKHKENNNLSEKIQEYVMPKELNNSRTANYHNHIHELNQPFLQNKNPILYHYNKP